MSLPGCKPNPSKKKQTKDKQILNDAITNSRVKKNPPNENKHRVRYLLKPHNDNKNVKRTERKPPTDKHKSYALSSR